MIGYQLPSFTLSSSFARKFQAFKKVSTQSSSAFCYVCLMNHSITVYNSLSRKKEAFQPLNSPFVGMYVCGPTVYGDAHLGHARANVSFDLIYRYLLHSGYKVRYVRNITDVGHLENDADEGEDKIGKKAKLEQLEPMEVVQLFSNNFHEDMAALNTRKPSIEPRASGHIPEQIKMIEQLIEKGFAYVSDGSVYFDVLAYNKHYPYGELSGRVLDDLIAGAGEERRTLDGQDEKRNSYDFALWKKAKPEHIMRWESPWSHGFPGWHIECSAMSSKYLGTTFDIHGGGMDLLFPHHECEVAQSKGCNHEAPAKYWLHNNMITINGQKMGKSLGNSISLRQLFVGDHPLLARGYNPMTVRFFILQAHYRSTLDFSNEALDAAEKGLKRLMQAAELAEKLNPSATSTVNITALQERCDAAMNDDFNSPILIAELFEAASIIHKVHTGTEQLNQEDLTHLQTLVRVSIQDILGLKAENIQDNSQQIDGLVQILIELRNQAKQDKNYAQSDALRDRLLAAGIQLKDSKEGTTWSTI